MSKYEYTPCPFCKSIVEIDVSWAIRNGRVFCNGCCKSFDIRIGEETESEPPKKEVPVEKVEDRTKEQFDKEVEKILEDDEPFVNSDGFWF